MSEELTIEQVGEKYGKVPLCFSYYYKYVFDYHGIAADGVEIIASYGGTGDDVYRYEVTPDKVEHLGEDFKTGGWRAVHLYREGKEIFAWLQP